MATTIVSSEWAISLQGQGQIVQGLAAIKQRLNILLNTPKGSDPLRKRFGIGVFASIDKPSNSVLPAMRKDILDAVAEFMPEIKITKLTGQLDGGHIIFDIYYSITNTSETDSYTQDYAFTNS